MAIDSHMHINSLLLDNPKEYIENINISHNIEYVINVGLNVDTSKEFVFISKTNKKFYSTKGIRLMNIFIFMS